MPSKLKSFDRVDYMPFSDDGPDGSYMNEKMEMNDDGYLKGRAIATNVGVFPYLMDDGSVQYELRPPEEVFESDSIASLKGIPMTNDHPSVRVTSENAKKYGVGFTGDVRQDQYHLAPSLTITDAEAVQDVQDGKKALSCGYTLDLEFTAGTWMGVHYDAIQRNIRYNHLAIVPKGRAGDAAKMKLDSIDSVGVQKIDNEDRRPSSMIKIKIDGMTFEVEENLATVIQTKLDELEVAVKSAKTNSDELGKAKTELSKKDADFDTLKDDNDKLKGDIKALKEADHSDEISKAVKERIDLEKAAEKAGVEVKEDSTDDALKKEIILTVYPSAKEKLDSCDAVYLNARYDGAIESLEGDNGNSSFRGDSLKNEKKTGKKKVNTDEDDSERTSDDARNDMVHRFKSASEAQEG